MSVAGNASGKRVRVANRREVMRAFDRLPKPIRKAIANADYPWDVQGIAKQYRAMKGRNRIKRVALWIAAMDSKRRREEAAKRGYRL